MQVYVWYWLTAPLWAVYTVHCKFAGCPDDYRMHGGICYKAFDQTENFLGASKICFTDGGTLAMPKDNNTNAFLISLINNSDDVDPTEFWFGLVDQHEEGDWEWIDGTPIGNYSAWSQSPGSQSQDSQSQDSQGEDSQSQESQSEHSQSEHSQSEDNPSSDSQSEDSQSQDSQSEDSQSQDSQSQDSQSQDSQSQDSQSSDSQSSDSQSQDSQSQESQSEDSQSEDSQSEDSQSEDNPSSDSQSSDSQSSDSQSEDSQSEDSQSSENQSSDSQSQDSQSEDSQSEDNPSSDNPSSDSQSEDSQSEDSQSDDSQSEDSQSEDSQSEDSQSSDSQSEDNQSSDSQSEDSQSEDSQSEDSQSEDNTSSDSQSEDSQSQDSQSQDSQSEDSQSQDSQSEDSQSEDSQSEEDCAEYSPTTWNDECSKKRRFICQIILADCPEGYVYHKPSRVCYKAYNDTKDYQGAVATCSTDGGTLAMPRDTATNTFLIYLKNAVDDSAWFRFGLTDLHQEGTWMWDDNVTLGNFSARGSGEPNDFNGQDEDCAEYFPGNWYNRKNKWNDGPCSSNDRKFICQVIPTDDSTTVPSEMPSHSTGQVMEQSSSTSNIKPEVTPSIDAFTTHSVPSVGTERPSPSTVMGNPSSAATIMPEVTRNINTTSGTTPNAAQSSSRPPVLARRNVSLTLTARHPVNRSLLRDSIRQSLEKLDNGFCGDQCQIGEIFLYTNGARKKRQAGDQILINVIIQLIVLANQQQGDNTNATVEAVNLLQGKAEALRQLARSGGLSVSINGEQIRLVDNGDNSSNCPLGQGNCDEEKKTPRWLVGVVCAAVVVLVIIAVVTVLLCRRKHNPGANVPGKGGNEMKNLATPERHDHAASEGTVDNIIYNTEDEGFVDNVIYNAGDDGTVDNIIYQGQDSKSNDQENAPESQYESVN